MRIICGVVLALVPLLGGCIEEFVQRAKQSLLDLADEASAWAEDNADLFGGPETLHNGLGDAARHQYWSCLIAVLYDEQTSLSLTTAWENASIDNGGPALESEMDLLNNAEGVRLARSIGSNGEQARIDCARAVLDNIVAGNYAILVADDLVLYPAGP